MQSGGNRMKLDPRIKSIDSIRCFNTNNYDCLGKFGYFTKFVENFDDLDKIRKGVCGFKDGSCFPFYEAFSVYVFIFFLALPRMAQPLLSMGKLKIII